MDRIENLAATTKGVPLPPGYSPVDPANLIPDVPDDNTWDAYDGKNDIGALQAFYYRELPIYGWEISEFIPFPNQVDIHFARLRIQKGNLTATLGLMPTAEKKVLGKIVVKYE